MASNQYLIDATTRHQIFVQRFAGGVANDLRPSINELVDNLIARLRADPTEFQAARAFVLLQDLESIIESHDALIAERLGAAVAEFAPYESEFAVRMLNGAVNVDLTLPAPAQILATVTAAPMALVSGQDVLNVTIDDIIDRLGTSNTTQIRSIINAGIIEGATNDQIIRRVGTNYANLTRRNTDAVVRTVVNHVASEARTATYAENSDIIESEEWVATLDGRTTAVCQARDGQIYPVGEGPTPPAHYRCRSLRVPRVREQFRIPGLEGERASVRGPEPASTTYNSWLRRQSAEFQNEVLGLERARIFRRGVPVQRFVDDQGRTLTLMQLREREGLTL